MELIIRLRDINVNRHIQEELVQIDCAEDWEEFDKNEESETEKVNYKWKKRKKCRVSIMKYPVMNVLFIKLSQKILLHQRT